MILNASNRILKASNKIILNASNRMILNASNKMILNASHKQLLLLNSNILFSSFLSINVCMIDLSISTPCTTY